jgi:hypothetical protein
MCSTNLQKPLKCAVGSFSEIPKYMDPAGGLSCFARAPCVVQFSNYFRPCFYPVYADDPIGLYIARKCCIEELHLALARILIGKHLNINYNNNETNLVWHYTLSTYYLCRPNCTNV